MSNLIKEILDIPYKISERNRKKREELTNVCKELVEKAHAIRIDFDTALPESSSYIGLDKLHSLKSNNSEVYEKIKSLCKKKHDKNIIAPYLIHFQAFVSFYENLENKRIHHNKQYIVKQTKEFGALLSRVEGHPLDQQQIECILKDEENHLVIAGAGTGKTTTILGKVEYLLKASKYLPDELLVLSFTNASATEMADRIKKETSQNIDVMTFHKLGLSIIAAVEDKKPSITSIDLYDLIRHSFAQLLGKDDYFNKLLVFFISFMREYKNEFNCKTEQEYKKYLSDNAIETIRHEKVKSFEEMMIANFLFLNGIEYIYEQKYEHDTADKEHSQYKPDFYLPDYKIYIEHFAINKNGNVPSFFRGSNEKTAKELYNEGIKWKRETHKLNNTKLIETYSYEASEGYLTKNLQKKLEKEGVVLIPINSDEFLKIVQSKDNNELTGLIELFMTFINLAKANNYSISDLYEKNKAVPFGINYLRNEAFLGLLAPIYEEYNRTLALNNEIDFNDMINMATDYVNRGLYLKKYLYIIIDEYQDISNSRYKLVKAIKERNQSKLFCVGDDWQSIYRFTGSDINYFINFEKYWGPTEKSFIETTYRFSDSIVSVSSNFIQENPYQFKKNLKSKIHEENLAFGFTKCSSEHYLTQEIKKRLDQLPQKSTVFLLGRYTLDINRFLDNDFELKHDIHNDKKTIIYKRRRDLNIEFLTVHKSKGLQADYVFIINNKKQRLGFPSNIQDDNILKLVLEQKEEYPYSEERRLFYVALTRARKYVWLLIVKHMESVFVSELESKYSVGAKEECNRCPGCGNGMLVYREGKFGAFWGCSNYPECTYTRNIKSKTNIN